MAEFRSLDSRVDYQRVYVSIFGGQASDGLASIYTVGLVSMLHLCFVQLSISYVFLLLPWETIIWRLCD